MINLRQQFISLTEEGSLAQPQSCRLDSVERDCHVPLTDYTVKCLGFSQNRYDGLAITHAMVSHGRPLSSLEEPTQAC